MKREVDFLVVKNGNPWFLVETKTSDRGISPSLYYFQKETGASHAFQAVLDRPFVAKDCFLEREPTIVPACTLFSQLI